LHDGAREKAARMQIALPLNVKIFGASTLSDPTTTTNALMLFGVPAATASSRI
jgi:hypothetical protein